MNQTLARARWVPAYRAQHRRVVYFVLLLALAALAALAWKLVDDRQKERALASGALQLQSQALTNVLDGAFGSAEQTLSNLSEQVQSHPAGSPLTDQPGLRAKLLRSPFLQDLRLYGANGTLLARGALTPLESSHLPDWLVSQQAEGRSTGLGSATDELAIFRTVRGANGLVQGTLMATFAKAYFQGLAEQIPGAGLEASFLLGPANELLMDVDTSAKPANRDAALQLARQIAVLVPDQGARYFEMDSKLVVVQQLRSQPIRLVQAVSKEVAFERWTAQLIQTAAMAVMIVLATALFLFHWLRSARQAMLAANAMDELQREQQRLIKAIPVGVYKYRVCASGKDQFDYVSERLCQDLGLQAAAILRDPRLAFNSYQPPDLDKLLRATADALATDGHMVFEGRLVGEVANPRWLRLESVLTRLDNGDQVWDGIQSDITERVRSEQVLRESEAFVQDVLNSMQHQIAVIDGTGTILAVNEAWREFSRENSQQPGQLTPYTNIGTNYLKICGNAGPEAIDARAGILAVLEGHQPSYSQEYPCQTPLEQRWFTMNVGPMRDGRKGAVIVHSDITACKQTEATLHEKARELLRSNSELEQFSYAISHDMRQPLRMISSYLQLLQKGLGDTLDAELREFFNFAIDGAKRLDAMLLGLLDYSRVGRKGEPPAWIDSRAVLDEALLFLRPLIAEAKAELRIEGDWPRVFVSPDELLRLLQNLIANALKFRVAARVPQIAVASASARGEWQLCITDNGVGMASDQIGRLFQVFQRLQSRAAYEGNGIGLALCRKIAEHHGGTIRAESAGEGLGSRFCVALPMRQEVDKAIPGERP